ncbi:FAD:protein FMN transferase, partial [Aegicerativicinus sediminis]
MKIYRFILILCFLIFTLGCKEEIINQRLNGPVFGTSYSIVYDKEQNFQKEIDSLLEVINASMSTYRDNSIITEINKSNGGDVDEHFMEVFNVSKNIYNQTAGVFDPTIGILVNAWDFGPEGG